MLQLALQTSQLITKVDGSLTLENVKEIKHTGFYRKYCIQ